ncbi:MAG: TIGR00730 family Rossman fold protein [Muribaculaceae bacterium]|nr:TIGR00730 family Rossman fold protein [Muribaculaceae bacterium]
MNIVVFCSSRSDLDAKYTATAQLAGKIIGETGNNLLYGGVDAGMMHITAKSAAEHGAKIIGVLPQFFEHRADKLIDEMIVARSLSERKEIMLDRGDVFIILPGGLGTLDEWFSALAHLEVMQDCRRKIVVVNIAGIFDCALSQITATAHSAFARSERFKDLDIVVDNITEFENTLTTLIKNYGKE